MIRHVLILGVALSLLLAGCGTNQKDKLQTETMDRYAMLVRWSQFDSLVDYIHPDWLEAHPVRQLDVDRLHQFRVTEYRMRQLIALDDGSGVARVVQIRLHHIQTARERTIQHVEAWRWDDERERWLLHSGLPDVTAGRR